MQATIEQVRNLERLYIEGYEDSFIDRSLRKIISHQLARDEADLEVLSKDLSAFEQQYGMTSDEFFSRYQEGELGDEIDFVEWNALYKMYSRLRRRLNILRGQEA
jgi:hypothetical protein